MDKNKTMNYELVAKVLFESYETIYDIDLKDSSYSTFHESDDYSKLELQKSGEDFFAALPKRVPDVVVPEDQDYVLRMLSKNNLIAALDKEKYYSFIYRVRRDGKDVYHKIRATYQQTEEGMHVFLGIRDVDSMMRREEFHRNELSAMKQKEHNHLQAVLDTAAAYMEANITKDIMLEKSDDHIDEGRRFVKKLPTLEDISSYTKMHSWICENLVVENKEKYEYIGSRDHLLHCFEEGDKRAAVSFSVYTKEEGTQPCQEVIFLYKNTTTEDIHAFCVIYDLTEHQKQEREVEKLEQALQLSRLRNFTSQMHPHFLYNALGSIQEVILMNPEYAAELLGYFTVHLRSCIQATTKDEPLSFSQELDNIKAYINIEKMRFGDKLHVIYDIKDNSFPILPLTIQPLVENAVRHGIYRRGIEGGTVRISSWREGDCWIVQVSDNGIGFDVEGYRKEIKSGKSNSTGIENIKFRLEKVMGANLKIDSKPGEGTVVTVCIPKGE